METRSIEFCFSEESGTLSLSFSSLVENLNTSIGVEIFKFCAENFIMSQGSFFKLINPRKLVHGIDPENRIINVAVFL